jgi:hypothetical protein
MMRRNGNGTCQICVKEENGSKHEFKVWKRPLRGCQTEKICTKEGWMLWRSTDEIIQTMDPSTYNFYGGSFPRNTMRVYGRDSG